MSMHKMLLRAALALAVALPAMAEPKDQVVEVACGSCIYEMDGVEGCEAAVRIDGQPYLLKGVKGLDAHAAGLCKAPKHARVLGELQDGVFVTKGFQLASIEQIAEAGCGACIYHLPDARGCPMAVKIGDTAYLVTGNVNTDAMALHLCTKPKSAKIAGTIQDGKFVAESLEFEPTQGGADHQHGGHGTTKTEHHHEH